ncbi:polysaccharide export outer membrane protein [Rhodobacter viridis]|uniref:Polysaccharide export outer membrane protein n=1 Tax=Rhodobacter viridis TaxID=1054202 RepID=A0A318UB72_9RHOB|nr:polysaccharide biosynthesis/export family protein [Rhodobacter viridis]PYF09369.1 polysaccharide export outer membrane protein [Rhodobacter viridis]
MLSKPGLVVAVLLTAVFSGCTLPRGAAMQSEILSNADDKTPSFAHYPVDSKLLSELSDWPAAKSAAAKRSWIKGGSGGAGQVLAAGDTVALSIWEGGQNKLLTSEGAPTTQIAPTTVANNGQIFVPYVGAVKVSGLSIEAAREKVQQSVTALIPEAQVQLAATPGKGNAVSLIGGVSNPGTIPLVDRSLTVLGAISEAGGVQASIENPQVRLYRGGKVYETSMQRVLDDPALDTGLRPGDKLMVLKDDRNFLSLGAAGVEKIIPFPKDHVNALEAVTLAGGINDSRANPKGVLILREYPASAVRSDATQGPQNARVVFSMDLTTSEGLFSAQNFEVQPNDLVLATESALVNTRTILGLFGSTLGLARTADAVAN